MLAPWTFIEDFSGDGQRDLVTAGFDEATSANVDLDDMKFIAWSGSKGGTKWSDEFEFSPFGDGDQQVDTVAHVTEQTMFATEAEADEAAAELGCSGSHQMGDMWMVCSDMSADMQRRSPVQKPRSPWWHRYKCTSVI